MYKPEPIDTSKVVLSETLLELTELLAENSHDNWAAQRISDGWTYGPERNDREKKHPDLVPYEALPESEKIYDRDAATQTIKAIIALGFRVERS